MAGGTERPRPGNGRPGATTPGDARAWLAGFAAAHPGRAGAPRRPGFPRGVDVYRPDDLVAVVRNAMEVFRARHGRFPSPHLPCTADHWFALKVFDHIPMPNPADKLLAAAHLPAGLAGAVHIPARPWVSDRPVLPADDAVPPGAYFLKTALGNGDSRRLVWPPDAGTRAGVEAGLALTLALPYGVAWGEWWYGLGQNRAFLEEDLSERMEGRTEVKVYVRAGRVALFYAIRHEDCATACHAQRYHGADLRPLEGLTEGFRPYDGPLPETIGAMLEVAAAIGRRFRTVRVDFIDAGFDRPTLGELTLCDLNARRVLRPESFEREACRLLFG